MITMTPQELRTERRRRAYSTAVRERNGTPTPTERMDQIRTAREVDQAIAAEHPELRHMLIASDGEALSMRRRQLELLKLSG